MAMRDNGKNGQIVMNKTLHPYSTSDARDLSPEPDINYNGKFFNSDAK